MQPVKPIRPTIGAAAEVSEMLKSVDLRHTATLISYVGVLYRIIYSGLNQSIVSQRTFDVEFNRRCCSE